MTPILYSFRRCPYAMRARLAIQVSGTAVELREIVLRNKPADMLKVSPKGTVPVLVTDKGVVVDESLDIMLWALGNRDPLGWLAGDRSGMLQLIGRTESEFKFHLDRYKYGPRFPGENSVAHRDSATVFLLELQQRLAAHRWLFGDRPTIADMAILPFVRQFANTDRGWFDAQDWPDLLRCLESFLHSPLFLCVMQKYPPWQPGDAMTYFGSETTGESVNG